MLELDRCLEEKPRLVMERRSLQEWFSEEWAVVKQVLEMSGTYELCTLFLLISIQVIMLVYTTSLPYTNTICLVSVQAGRNVWHLLTVVIQNLCHGDHLMRSS